MKNKIIIIIIIINESAIRSTCIADDIKAWLKLFTSFHASVACTQTGAMIDWSI